MDILDILRCVDKIALILVPTCAIILVIIGMIALLCDYFEGSDGARLAAQKAAQRRNFEITSVRQVFSEMTYGMPLELIKEKLRDYKHLSGGGSYGDVVSAKMLPDGKKHEVYLWEFGWYIVNQASSKGHTNMQSFSSMHGYSFGQPTGASFGNLYGSSYGTSSGTVENKARIRMYATFVDDALVAKEQEGIYEHFLDA